MNGKTKRKEYVDHASAYMRCMKMHRLTENENNEWVSRTQSMHDSDVYQPLPVPGLLLWVMPRLPLLYVVSSLWLGDMGWMTNPWSWRHGAFIRSSGIEQNLIHGILSPRIRGACNFDRKPRHV